MDVKQASYGRKAAEGQVPGIQPPARRPLKFFAFDPSLRRTAGNLAIVEVANEPLTLGPEGRLVRVVDYDASKDVYYPPVDLEDPDVLMQRGLDPSDSDPRFHQQMTYAVVMKVIEDFERALGRPFRFSGDRKLTVLPHAFEGENAFYDPDTTSLHFGYFAADAEDPGENLPGQTVFTCLSHNIVAHETTHAIVDRLRDQFNAPTYRDVLAFHEGLADIVAIFQHFSFPEVLRHEIRATRADLSLPGRLLELARQFGYATGSGQALRSASGLDGAVPDRSLYRSTIEPHDRGSILVAAVFDAFFRIYRNRTADLIRAVSGGSGILPAGDLQSDLVTLATREASQASQEVLTMCLRAFEYLPPVDVTYGDYLRAIVTADFELNPRDEFERRASFIDSFRRRGIYAPNVSSLAEAATSSTSYQATVKATRSSGRMMSTVTSGTGPAVATGAREWRQPAPKRSSLAETLWKRPEGGSLMSLDSLRRRVVANATPRREMSANPVDGGHCQAAASPGPRVEVASAHPDGGDTRVFGRIHLGNATRDQSRQVARVEFDNRHPAPVELGGDQGSGNEDGVAFGQHQRRR